jgi:DNA ligase (NAD+)
LARLVHFASRNAFDIEGLAERTIEIFFDEGLLKSPADIFRLEEKLSPSDIFSHKTAKREGFLPLQEREGWGHVSANKLFDAIRRRNKIPLDRFIYSLGIDQVGEATAKLLARKYVSLKNFLKAMKAAQYRKSEDYNHLESINGIGPIIAEKILAFFANSYNMSIVDDIVSQIEVKDFEISHAQTSQLAGKTIVFTGTLETMTRNEAKAKAESLGAIVTANVSSNTDLVIAGPGSGAKEETARKRNIPVLSETEWLKLLKSESK